MSRETPIIGTLRPCQALMNEPQTVILSAKDETYITRRRPRTRNAKGKIQKSTLIEVGFDDSLTVVLVRSTETY